MSKIVIGAGASHTTLMNTKWDEVDHLDRAHRFRDGLATARDAIAAASSDLVVIIGSNHFRGFWLDLMPAFTIGVGDVIAAGEHGTPEGPQPVDPTAAVDICNSLLASSFDVAFSTELQVDHGISHAVQYLVTGEVPIVPVIINAFAPPLPTLTRTVEFGRALGRAVAGLDGDRRVAVIATGGLSHSLPFPDWRAPESDDDEFLVESWRNGRGDWSRYEQRRRQIIVNSPPAINQGFDRRFLDAVTTGRWAELAVGTNDDLVSEAGNGGNEIRGWLAACAALDTRQGRTIAYAEMPEWLTGMGVALFDPGPGTDHIRQTQETTEQ